MTPAALARPSVAPVWRRAYREILARYVRLTQQHRYDTLVLEPVAGLPIVVLPGVFNPRLLRSGELLARYVQQSAPGWGAARVLDLGTGTGIGAVAAARTSATLAAIVASDINPHAVRCARINVLLNHVEQRVDVRMGDLFAAVADDERFDVVLFNPPFYRGTPRDGLDQAWRAPDLIERFAAQLAQHLAPRGRALLLLSSDGERAAFLTALASAGCETSIVAHTDFVNEEMWIHQVRVPC